MAKDQKPDYAWLAEKFEELRTTRDDGSPAFIANHGRYSFNELKSILETYEDFAPDVSQAQRQLLIGKAVNSACRAGQITAESLMRQLSSQKTRYYRSPKNNYVFLSSISMRRPPDLRRLAFDNAHFTFSDLLPKSFSRNGIDFNQHENVKPPRDFPNGFTKVRVRVEARSEFDAFDTAITSLDYLRGIWNFVINIGLVERWHLGPIKPVNSIYLGPVHTLHHPDGKLTTNTYWYEHVYPHKIEPERIKKWPKVAKETRAIRDIIKIHSYPCYMRETFVRYARSLDGVDHESSFLKAWSMLEWLTAINENENYGEIIKRVLFLFEDQDYHRQVLEHLRLRRNATVHKGQVIEDAEPLIFQLKKYVEWLIKSHLICRRRFDNPQQFGQMLSSPRDMNQLKKKLDDLENRVRILKEARKLWESSNE